MNGKLLSSITGAKIFELGQDYHVGMPHFPTHPPYLFSLTKKHGDLVTRGDSRGDVSSAADAIALGTHVGTHIDALCHFSCGGKLHGGTPVAPIQSYGEGIEQLSIDTVAPIVRRGVLLDIAGQQGLSALPDNFVIGPEHMRAAAAAHAVEIAAGDVVLLRTGWAQYWNDAARYITGEGGGGNPRGPGPEDAGARWLSEREVFAAGSDTVAFERVPSPTMPVHIHLLVESGIHIIEALNLEDLARAKVYSFLFIALPLKIRGGTGSPIRPIAITVPA